MNLNRCEITVLLMEAQLKSWYFLDAPHIKERFEMLPK